MALFWKEGLGGRWGPGGGRVGIIDGVNFNDDVDVARVFRVQEYEDLQGPYSTGVRGGEGLVAARLVNPFAQGSWDLYDTAYQGKFLVGPPREVEAALQQYRAGVEIALDTIDAPEGLSSSGGYDPVTGATYSDFQDQVLLPATEAIGQSIQTAPEPTAAAAAGRGNGGKAVTVGGGVLVLVVLGVLVFALMRRGS